jgi:hypothetical protein
VSFKKYQHVERWGREEVEGIENGTCYVFPKLDGTNASVWMEDGEVRAGSRKRGISIESDNHGFCHFATADPCLLHFLQDWPAMRLYGEWLVPHSLKTYREDAWRKFYVFDVVGPALNEDGFRYIPYDEYKPILEEYGIDYIPCTDIVEGGSEKYFLAAAERNTFLMQPGEIGEGIVIKNYLFRNRWNHIHWAKIVRSEFKEKHCKAMGPNVQQGEYTVERRIADEYVTQALVDKEKAKIDTKPIQPRLLSTVFHVILTEDIADAVKKFKNPTIDFRVLNRYVQDRVKQLAPDLF